MAEDREKLFTFWEELPALKIVDMPQKEVYGNKKIRSYIIRFLREGIIDEADEELRRRRHAFNAQEIKKNVKEFKDTSLQGLYFHLQKLKEAKLIDVVAILPKDNHNIKYYGRTARIFLNIDLEEDKKHYSKAFAAITAFAKAKNPSFDEKKVDEYLDRFMNYQQKQRERITEWLVERESAIVEHDIDMDYFYKFMFFIDPIHPEYIQIFKDMQDFLDLEFP